MAQTPLTEIRNQKRLQPKTSVRESMRVMGDFPPIVNLVSQLLDNDGGRLHSHRVTLQDHMKIPGGTTIYIGPPAKPIPKQICDAIGTALGNIVEIEEAHLPMVYAKGHIDPPAQVLVIVLDQRVPSPHTRIRKTLGAVLPTDLHLDITELQPSDANLPTIRATGTQLNLNRKLT